jgi:hypothetical protein
MPHAGRRLPLHLPRTIRGIARYNYAIRQKGELFAEKKLYLYCLLPWVSCILMRKTFMQPSIGSSSLN